jgi:hypothetical protein
MVLHDNLALASLGHRSLLDHEWVGLGLHQPCCLVGHIDGAEDFELGVCEQWGKTEISLGWGMVSKHVAEVLWLFVI